MKILVYGSLRKDEFLFNSVKPKYIETVKVSGLELFGDRGYPFAKAGDGVVVCDIIEVTAQQFLMIYGTELGAGYQMKMKVVGEDIYPIFLFEGETPPKIEHGDWSKHLKEATREESRVDKV